MRFRSCCDLTLPSPTAGSPSCTIAEENRSPGIATFDISPGSRPPYCNSGSFLFRFHLDPFAGTEELGHLEMIGAIVHQLTRNLKDSQIQDSAFAPYFVDHTVGVYPTAASGFPWNAASMQVKGDPIADLAEDLGAEQKARVTYDNILRLSDDPDVNDVIKFLREREIVHFQRFGEAMELLRQKLNKKNVYFMNPAFDI